MFQRSMLRDTGIEPLAEAVYEVLENVGVLAQNREMLNALEASGAKVDHSSERVTYPRRMVQDFIEGLRKETQQQKEEGDSRFTAPALPHLSTQLAQFFYDYSTKERRSGNTQDFITLTKLGNVLHSRTGVGHSLLMTDVPAMLEPMEAAILLAEYADNPAPAFAWNVKQVDYLIEMGEVLGIKDWFTLGAICFAHPLRFDKDVADRFVHRAKSGGSIGLTSMAVAGATAPVTLAGYVALASAEHVATWLTARALNPAVPLGGSMWAGTVDMRTGAVSYYAFDAMFYGFATVEFLRRWCGMDIVVGGGEYCDAKVPGLYAALEKAYKAMLIAAFSSRHPEIGQGMVEDGKTMSPVQLLLERDLGMGVQQLGREMKVTPEDVALPTILEVGIGLQTNYFETNHTFRHFRSSLWLPEFIDRSGWSGFENEEKMLDNIQRKVEDLLASYKKPEVDEDKLARMRQVVERARKELLQ